MKKIKFITVWFCVCVLLFSAGCGKPQQGEENQGNGTGIVIADSGKSDYVIVVPEDAEEAEIFAGEELQNFIMQSTGAKLSVSDDKNLEFSEDKKYISVGKTLLREKADIVFDYTSLNNDGFILKTAGKSVFICGGRSRGTLYGAYEFIERFLGVRFLSPDYTYVPKVSRLEIGSKDIVEKPAFAYRNYYSGQLGEDPLFATRMRMISESTPNVAKYGYGMTQDFFDTRMHNSHLYVNYAVNSVTHPDWFSDSVEGTVIADYQVAEVCFTNGVTDDGKLSDDAESVAKTFIETLKSNILSKPEAQYFMIGQMDNHVSCRCARCTESNLKNGGASGTLIAFMNVISDEIGKWLAEEFPGENKEITIVTFAYQDTETAPVKNENGKIVPASSLAVPRDNITVRLAPMSANYYYSMNDAKQREQEKQMFEFWKVVTDNFFIWDYATNYEEFLWYFPNFGALGDNYKFYRDLGVKYVLSQSSFNESNHFQTEMKLYVASKLMWNPERDAVQLRDEFITLYYGDYANDVKEFVNYMDSFWVLNAQSGKQTAPFDSREFLSGTSYPVAFLENAQKIITSARQKLAESALSSEQKTVMDKRLVRVLLTPERMILRNFQTYYRNADVKEYAEKFFEHMEYAGCAMIGETRPASTVKLEYGL